MTISSENRKAGPYIGQGVLAIFPFTFKVFSANDLVVTEFDTSSSVETALVINSGYTVQLNADQNANPGGTITLPAVLATGKTLTITSDVAYLQPTDLTNQGGFFPQTITTALDRLTVLIQQLRGLIGRGIRQPVSDADAMAELPPAADRAGKVLTFDANGNPVATVPESGSIAEFAAYLSNDTDPAKGAALSGFEGNTVRDELLRLAVPVDRFEDLVVGGDWTEAFAAAISAAQSGSKLVLLGPRTYTTDYVRPPDNMTFVGSGKWATVVKRNTTSVHDLVRKADGAIGIGVQFRDMSFDGNSENTNDGGFVWDSSDVERGPSLIMKNVYITQCRKVVASRSDENAAVLLYGGTFGVAEDLDIFHNQNAVGLWHKGSDWVFTRLWLGPNGANVPTYSMIVQGGVANKFSDCYFGGNGGLGQIQMLGTARNKFSNCFVDNSYREAIVFDDSLGQSCKDNVFIGGAISNSGYSTNNTYAAVSLQGSSHGNLFVGTHFSNDLHPTALPKCAFEELYTATGNYVIGCALQGPWGAAPVIRRSGSSTVYISCPGYDESDFASVLATKLVQVLATFNNDAPSVTNHLFRLTRGGTSLLGGSRGYAEAWLQAIQDDGSNAPKELHINPLGGTVQIGAAGTGLRLIAPNGAGYVLTVSNAGSIVVTAG